MACPNPSRSMFPRLSLRTVTVWNRHVAAVAGLVPCAESGIIILVRLSPLSAKYLLAIMTPSSSPWEPAAGCRLNASMPVISLRASCSSHMTSSAPCAWDGGALGWMPANPGSLAMSSFTRGLYFMVHEPSGYMPVSIP